MMITVCNDTCVASYLFFFFKHVRKKKFDLEGWIFKEKLKERYCSVRSTPSVMFNHNPWLW